MAEIKVVTFLIGKEKYGIEITKIDAVTEFNNVTRLPNAPIFVEGVFDFREKEVLPLINLRRKFNLPEYEDKKNSKILILKLNGKKIGLLVDDVKDVVSFSPDKIEEKPDILGINNLSFIFGIVKASNIMIIILDINKLLSEKEKKELNKIRDNL
jgi:purine-binding chemotaxis protein CheW